MSYTCYFGGDVGVFIFDQTWVLIELSFDNSEDNTTVLLSKEEAGDIKGILDGGTLKSVDGATINFQEEEGYYWVEKGPDNQMLAERYELEELIYSVEGLAAVI